MRLLTPTQFQEQVILKNVPINPPPNLSYTVSIYDIKNTVNRRCVNIRTNINYNDELSTNAIKSMTSEAIQLTTVFVDMKTEINLLLECLNTFIDKINNNLADAFSTSVSEGFNLQKVVSDFSEVLGITANTFAIFTVNMVALKAGGVAFFSLLAEGFMSIQAGIA